MKKAAQLKEADITPFPSLKTFSVMPVYFAAFTHKIIFIPFMKYMYTVVKDFFLLQFSVKFGWRKIEVIQVDHPLDDEVPFVPEKVSIYLDFVNFWIRPLAYLQKKIGMKSYKYIGEFLNSINICYKNASHFYKFRMSTTNRPKYYKNFHFITIHALDPHYLCVPSLHVSVVTLAHSYFKKIFAELQFSQDEQDFYNHELYAGATDITETVLYIKQHSANCIPAALYMMTHLTPDIFSVTDAVDFIDQLFITSTDIAPDKKILITQHLHDMFEQLVLEGCHESDWIAPMRRWILKYKNA